MCVCVCVCACTVTHLPLPMHISGDGGVVLVGLGGQEPHRVQDWSELPVVRYMYMQPHLSVLFKTCKKSYQITMPEVADQKELANLLSCQTPTNLL